MKFFIVFAAIVVIAIAAPLDSDADAKTIHQSLDIEANGEYDSKLETSNGINTQENGDLKSIPDAETKEAKNVIVQSGKYSYVSPEGQTITVTWTADELGYHPVGDHLPVAPVA